MGIDLSEIDFLLLTKIPPEGSLTVNLWAEPRVQEAYPKYTSFLHRIEALTEKQILAKTKNTKLTKIQVTPLGKAFLDFREKELETQKQSINEQMEEMKEMEKEERASAEKEEKLNDILPDFKKSAKGFFLNWANESTRRTLLQELIETNRNNGVLEVDAEEFDKATASVSIELAPMAEDMVPPKYQGIDLVMLDPKRFLRAISDAASEVLTDKKQMPCERLQRTGHFIFLRNLKNACRSLSIPISKIREPDIGKFVLIEGTIKTAREVTSFVFRARYSCNACVFTTDWFDYSYPDTPRKKMCPTCKAAMAIEERKEDRMQLVIQEDIQTGGTQEVIPCVLQPHLCLEKYTQRLRIVGTRAIFAGIIKERTTFSATDKDPLGQYKKWFDCISFDFSESDWAEIPTTTEEIEMIKTLAELPDGELKQKFFDSFCPEIIGVDDAKEGILLALAGGTNLRTTVQSEKYREKPIHVLLYGDPSCLVGDTRVLLASGRMPQLNQLLPGKQGVYPISLNLQVGNETVEATEGHVFENQPTLKITLSSGKTITGTHNHPLFVKDKGWTRLDELKLGDELRVFYDVKQTPNEATVTPQFARLAGFFTAEGWREHTGRKHNYKRIGIGVPLSEEKILDGLIDDYETQYGKRLTKTFRPERTDKNGVIRKPQVWLRTAHYGALFDILLNQKERRIPDSILDSNNLILSEYLKFLFEGEGYVNGTKGARRVFFATVSEGLVRDVQIALLRFGIYSNVFTKTKGKGNWNACYCVSIGHKADLIRFKERIGFVSERKNAGLSNLTLRYAKPYDEWEEVVKIEDAGIQTVYDLHIPNKHYFWANGIFSHNTGKTSLMNGIEKIAPKVKRTSGKGASGVGLTVSIVQDKETGKWTSDAGLLVLANRGVALIDEIQEMEPTTLNLLKDPMQDQKVRANKAGLSVEYPADTTVIASGNPKYTRFDTSADLIAQIPMNEAVLSRFVFKFLFIDKYDKELHKRKVNGAFGYDTELNQKKGTLSSDFLRKYLSYVKQTVKEVAIPQSVVEKVLEYSDKVASKASGTSNNMGLYSRNFDDLRLAIQANAKLHLRTVANDEDCDAVLNLYNSYMNKMGFDPDTGLFDADKLAGGMSASRRSKGVKFDETFKRFQDAAKGDTVKASDFVKELVSREGFSESEAWKWIEEMKSKGLLYEPKFGELKGA